MIIEAMAYLLPDDARPYAAAMEPDEEFAVQAAIAQRTRWSIIALLSGRDALPAGLIAETLGLTPTNLSMQLSILSDAGLVTAERDGRRVRYSLVRERLAGAGDVLRRLAAADGGGGTAA